MKVVGRIARNALGADRSVVRYISIFEGGGMAEVDVGDGDARRKRWKGERKTSVDSSTNSEGL